MKINFKACKHLDYSDAYTAKKKLMSSNYVFWLRNVPEDMPRMVQFCKLRGRLNHHEACIGSCNAQCGEYSETEHSVEVEKELINKATGQEGEDGE